MRVQRQFHGLRSSLTAIAKSSLNSIAAFPRGSDLERLQARTPAWLYSV